MKRLFDPVELHDRAPTEDDFLEQVLTGLRRPQKTTPSKFLYDRRGSQLFDQICELREYYPTRTEIGIMTAHAPEMARLCGSGCLLFEYGSGSSTKTPILLDCLDAPAAYAPIDISREHLIHSAAAVAARYPDQRVTPLCADFT
ncbi:MAG: L-histidine N(alpha)-methyltransferase, partial [Phycisphaerae bacterium]